MSRLPPECRICFSSDEESSSLIRACKCRGSMEFTHENCLKIWVKMSKRTNCEACMQQFRGVAVTKEAEDLLMDRHSIHFAFMFYYSSVAFTIVLFTFIVLILIRYFGGYPFILERLILASMAVGVIIGSAAVFYFIKLTISIRNPPLLD